MSPDSDCHSAPQKDHDLLIRIDANVRSIKEAIVNHEARISKCEMTQAEQRGAWKVASVGGAVAGAIVGAVMSMFKH